MRKKTYEERAMSAFAVECERCDGEGEWMQNEFIDTCPDCDGKGFIIITENNMEIDVITLLQLDAGAKLYTCKYTNNPKSKTYTFKSFDTYEPGDFAFVLPSGQGEPEFAKVVRIEGEGEFAEGIAYRWLCGPAVLPDMNAGGNLDASARRKIAIGKALEAAKATAAHMTAADYVPAARLSAPDKE